MAPGAIAFDWVERSRFLARCGETGLTGNIYTGLHEFSDMAYLLHFLRPTDVFVDVGANVGSYTILACGVVGARGFSFEPVPSTHARLIENLRLNHIETRVSHPNIGIGDQSGSIQFTEDGDTVNHALAAGEVSANTVYVQVETLDEVLSLEKPALMKIDVEGFETAVLRGAEKTLADPTMNSVIMELNGSGDRYGFDESAILELMFDVGFRSYSYEPFSRTFKDLEGKNLECGNTLFIKDRKYAEERVHSASKITLNGVSF